MNRKDQKLIWEAYAGDDSYDPNLEDSPTGAGWESGEYDPSLEQAQKVADGLYVEIEHTSPSIAQQVKSIPREELVKILRTVFDHLNETGEYYDKLKKAGL